MADFEQAFQRTMANEGGFKLTNIANDRGGQTYAGISRRTWPKWSGWAYVDRGEAVPTQAVRDFYFENFWVRLSGNNIQDQQVAQTIYDFAVNAGTLTAVKLAQIVVGTTPDGKVGPKTIAALNAADPHHFVAAYALAKLARYRDIVVKDRTQQKFLLGWINRILEGVAA